MAQTNILLESGTNELEIMEFYLDEPDYRGYYGVNVAKVVEILLMQPVTAMPQMRHPAVLGAFPYRRGQIVPLISLGRYLNKEVAESEESDRIIVTEFNTIVTGFLVSGVNRIHRISWNSVEEPGKFLQEMSRSSVTGVVQREGKVVFLLDLENVVADIDPDLAIRFDHVPENLANQDKVYTVLHADDSSSVRKLVKGRLESSGQFKVIQTTNGEEAWEMLKNFRDQAAGGKPLNEMLDAVISDIEMPRMDGLTLCRHIKEDPVLKGVPVALFSSLISPSLAHKGRSVGADAQFAKPDLQELSEKVIELINKEETAEK